MHELPAPDPHLASLNAVVEEAIKRHQRPRQGEAENALKIPFKPFSGVGF